MEDTPVCKPLLAAPRMERRAPQKLMGFKIKHFLERNTFHLSLRSGDLTHLLPPTYSIPALTPPMVFCPDQFPWEPVWPRDAPWKSATAWWPSQGHKDPKPWPGHFTMDTETSCQTFLDLWGHKQECGFPRANYALAVSVSIFTCEILVAPQRGERWDSPCIVVLL